MMFKLLMAALVAAAAVPAAAQAPAAADAQRQTEAALAYVAKLAEASKLQAAGMKKLADAQPLLASMNTPAAIKAAAPRFRAILAEARSGLRQSAAVLAAIVPPAEIRAANGITGATMLAEAREQNARGLSLLTDFDSFVAAAERGDNATAAKALPRLLEGSFMTLDTNAMIFRNRQAAMPPSQSVHQVLGIGVQLSRAMGAAGRAWLGVKLGGKGDAAAAQLRTQLAAVSGDARAMTREGRANLARELRELDQKAAGAAFSPEESSMVGRFRRAIAARESLFAIGDELAGLAAANEGISAAALAREATPQLLGQLSALEMKFQAAVTAHAAIGAGTSN